MTNEKVYSQVLKSPSQSIEMILKTMLKELLKEKDISIASLSRQTKVPLQTIHGWLNGSKPKNLEQVKSIANFLGVSLDHLCFGEEPLKKEKIEDFSDEINAGVFEVVLRRIKTKR